MRRWPRSSPASRAKARIASTSRLAGGMSPGAGSIASWKRKVARAWEAKPRNASGSGQPGSRIERTWVTPRALWTSSSSRPQTVRVWRARVVIGSRPSMKAAPKTTLRRRPRKELMREQNRRRHMREDMPGPRPVAEELLRARIEGADRHQVCGMVRDGAEQRVHHIHFVGDEVGVARVDLVSREVGGEEAGELVARLVPARHLHDQRVAAFRKQRQRVEERTRGAARGMPGDQGTMADRRVGSNIGNDQHRPAALNDDVIRQFRGNGDVFLRLAENDEVKGAGDGGEAMVDLSLAAAVEVHEEALLQKRLGRRFEGGPRRFDRRRIMRARPVRDDPDLVGVRLLRKEAGEPRPLSLGNAHCKLEARRGARMGIEMHKDVRKRHGRPPPG